MLFFQAKYGSFSHQKSITGIIAVLYGWFMKGTFGKNVDYQLWRFSDISWIISETCWNFLLKLAWWYIVVLLRDHRNGYFNKWIILSRRFYQSHTLSIQHRQHFQRLLLWHLNIQIFYFLVSVSGVFHYIGFSIFNFFY